MRKKLFTFLLAMVASIGMIHAEVYSGTCGENLTWTVDTETGVLHITGTGEMTNYYEASAPWWRSANNSTNSISSAITSIIIDDGVTTIGNFAFHYLKNVISVSLPNSITHIGNYAFDHCTKLSSLTLPYNLQYIDYFAFYGCRSLVSLVLPNSVASIGKSAFEGCSSLFAIEFGEAVRQIGNSIFYGCTSLQKIVWNTKRCTREYNEYNSPFYVDRSHNPSEYTYDIRNNISTIIIGNNVEFIPTYLFYGCTNAQVTIKNPFLTCGVKALADNIICDDSAKNDTTIVLCSQQDNATFTIKEEGELVTKTFDQTGNYSFTSICGNECFLHVINNMNFTQLPDTTVCNGEWVSLSGTYQYRYVEPFEQSQWSDFLNEFASERFISDFMEMGSQTDYFQWYAFQTYWENYTEIHGECDEQTKQGFETWYKSHFHDYASSCPEGVEYVRVSSDGEQFYSSRVYTRTYTNSQGCDSVVSCKVNVIRSIAPHIEVSPEQDTFNSGKIRIYNKYCTGSEYYEGQYNYFYQYAEYDYFTINGKKYDFSSAIEGEYNEYYHPDGIRVIDEPSTVIDNLHGGNYHIVFYSACDSVEEYIEIQQYGIEVDGIYYKFQEPYTFSYRGETYEFPGEATVTYRGTSSTEYDEYSGDIVIPESVEVDGQVYQVKNIGEEAFYGNENITSITLLGNEVKLSLDWIYPNPGSSGHYLAYSGIVYGYVDNNWSIYTAYETVPIYVHFGSLKYYKERYTTDYTTDIKLGVMNFHVINPKSTVIESGSTSATITFGNADEQKHIKACGLVEGIEFGGNIVEYNGVEPSSTYADVPFYVKTIEGDSDVIVCSFTTSALKLTTKPSRPVSATTAILLAETNMADAETNCGFEWKRDNAPESMAGTKVYCPVASGQMAGRLKNLKDDVYYKYRAFYQSAAGNMYYGDWQYIFTGDNAVEFDPILYTYTASVVTETGATLSGYALAGSEDFTEQGFEYWAESRTNGGANAPRRMTAALNEHFFVQASGISLRVTLTNLDAGTVYKYRVYGKVGDQYYYGSEQTFTTQGEYKGDDTEAIEDVQIDSTQSTKAQKFLHNGQIFILRGEKVYTTTGVEVK